MGRFQWAHALTVPDTYMRLSNILQELTHIAVYLLFIMAMASQVSVFDFKALFSMVSNAFAGLMFTTIISGIAVIAFKWDFKSYEFDKLGLVLMFAVYLVTAIIFMAGSLILNDGTKDGAKSYDMLPDIIHAADLLTLTVSVAFSFVLLEMSKPRRIGYFIRRRSDED